MLEHKVEQRTKQQDSWVQTAVEHALWSWKRTDPGQAVDSGNLRNCPKEPKETNLSSILLEVNSLVKNKISQKPISVPIT